MGQNYKSLHIASKKRHKLQIDIILDVDTTNGEVHSTVCSTLPIVQENPNYILLERMETEIRHLFVYFL
jgi:hypothetical protein